MRNGRNLNNLGLTTSSFRVCCVCVCLCVLLLYVLLVVPLVSRLARHPRSVNMAAELRLNSVGEGVVLASLAQRTADEVARLTYINFNVNALTSVPMPIWSAVSLTNLSLSFNHLVSVPVAIGRLRHLRVLALHSNSLEVVSVFFQVIVVPMCDVSVALTF